MRVAYTQRHRVHDAIEAALGATYTSLDHLLSSSDVVVVSCPLNADSRGLLSRARIASMKRGAVLVNTSRGACVDEIAVADALREGRLAGAALDVFAAEPAVSPEILACERAVLTPHLGSADVDTREAMAAICAESVLAVLDGREPRFIVR